MMTEKMLVWVVSAIVVITGLASFYFGTFYYRQELLQCQEKEMSCKIPKSNW